MRDTHLHIERAPDRARVDVDAARKREREREKKPASLAGRRLRLLFPGDLLALTKKKKKKIISRMQSSDGKKLVYKRLPRGAAEEEGACRLLTLPPAPQEERAFLAPQVRGSGRPTRRGPTRWLCGSVCTTAAAANSATLQEAGVVGDAVRTTTTALQVNHKKTTQHNTTTQHNKTTHGPETKPTPRRLYLQARRGWHRRGWHRQGWHLHGHAAWRQRGWQSRRARGVCKEAAPGKGGSAICTPRHPPPAAARLCVM